MHLYKNKLLILIILFLVLMFLVQFSYINELNNFHDQKTRTDTEKFVKKKHRMCEEELNIQNYGYFWNSWNLDNNARSQNDLQENLVPNNVYYVWCGNRTFQFKHYLSIVSVWKFLRADVIEIHYQQTPLQNKYDRWLDEILSSIPSFSMHRLPDYTDECSNLFGIDVLNDRGGIFVAEDTLLTSDILKYRRRNFTAIFDEQGNIKILLSSTHHRELKNIKIHLTTNTKTPTNNRFINKRRCLTVEDISVTGIGTPPCLVVKNVIIPSDIFTVPSSTGEFLRFLYFGVTDPVHACVDKRTSIPKIVHYIWYNESEMSFIMYLSILSTLYVVKPKKIYIHSDLMLYGYYWDRVKSESKVILIYREPPRQIYRNAILFRHHKSDVIRAEVLLKYGGIYVDWDVIWLRSIDDLLSTGYDVILNYDHMPKDYFPDTINMGVVIAKPGAKYLAIWQRSYRYYNNEDFFESPIEMPYKVYEKYPWLVHIETRLQVMCYMLLCHPIFHPDYKNFATGQPFDWKKDAYAIHFTHPDPPELKAEAFLRNSTGLFSDIGRHVLKEAGLL